MGFDTPPVMDETELEDAEAQLPLPGVTEQQPPFGEAPPGMMPSPMTLPEPKIEEAEPETVQLTDEEKSALKYIKDTLTSPDDETRERMVPIWETYEYYWRGLQDIIWDKTSQAFVSASGVLKSAGELEDTYIGSKIVNTYRAHGESIAAALSAGVPTIKFFPEDADDPQDIATAKAYSTASEYIGLDNVVKLLNLRAIYIRWNQPFVAYYNTYVYSDDYGTIQKEEYDLAEIEETDNYCPMCVEDMEQPGLCPDCGVESVADVSTTIVPTVTKITNIPKGRQKIEVYGPRHVRVPYNVKELSQCGYLILETEHHWAQLVGIFPGLTGKIMGGAPSPGTTTADASRLSRRAAEGVNVDQDQNTLERCWFRPWTFNLVSDEETRAALRVKFPDGAQVTWVDDDTFVEAWNEKMDDHWTLVPDPFAEHIHGDPLGKPMIPIQDMENDTVQLTLETILYGIPDRFADPTVLNFDTYKNAEKSPGQVFPAKRPTGMGLDAGFFEGSTARLSDNVEVFRQSLQYYGQFVTGDSPGIHGGALPKGSSRTADEYRQARQGAMQRLSTSWNCINIAWEEVMKKAVNELRKNMVFQGEDVRFVKEAGKGFTNVWIKLSELDAGNVGRVRSESAETFPLTVEQQRGAIMELLQTGIPQASQFFFAPENIGEMSRILIGMGRFKIPGEDDRDYQLEEIHKILTGQHTEVSPETDNHEIHVATLKYWASSEDGRKTKEVNPQGYAMVLEHLQQHTMILQQQMEAQMAQQAAQGQLPPGQEGQRPPGRGGQMAEQGTAELPSQGA